MKDKAEEFSKIRQKRFKDQMIYMRRYLKSAIKSLENKYSPSVQELELFDDILLMPNYPTPMIDEYLELEDLFQEAIDSAYNW